MNNLKPNSKDLKLLKVREAQILREQHIRRCLKDTYYWLTTGTKTFDDQDKLNSFKSFPDKEYIPHILDCLEYESTLFLEKSRTMMASWTVSGWCAHKGFNSPFTTVFQSQDEDRAVHDVENVKTLWSQSEPELQARWPLAKPMDKQPYNFLEPVTASVLGGHYNRRDFCMIKNKFDKWYGLKRFPTDDRYWSFPEIPN